MLSRKRDEIVFASLLALEVRMLFLFIGRVIGVFAMRSLKRRSDEFLSLFLLQCQKIVTILGISWIISFFVR
jgi:hypothetical protein